MKIRLKNVKVRLYESAIIIRADEIVQRYFEGISEIFKEWITNLKEATEKEAGLQVFSEVKEIIRTLQNAKVARDKDGSPIPDPNAPDGKKRIPWGMDDQRLNTEIMKPLNRAIAKLEDKGKLYYDADDVDHIDLELKPRYVKHLAKLVQEKCETYYATGPHIVDFYNRFAEYEADAQKIIKTGKASDDEDEEPDKSGKKKSESKKKQGA